MIEPPNIDEALPLLRRARDEDLGGGDITSEGTIPAGTQAVGTFLAKDRGVLCGTVLLDPLTGLYGPALTVELARHDGDRVVGGDIIGRVFGPARAMLAFERVALNFLQRLSGVATATKAYVEVVEEVLRARKRAGAHDRAGGPADSPGKCQILDTRKTTPGQRLLEKYAVRCGGGTNHRVGLFDAILVKDNHIALGHQDDLPGLARQLRARYPRMLIEIEVNTLGQFRQLLTGAPEAADMVLLDNMTVEQMAEAVQIRNELCPSGQPLLEASGGITLATVRAIAETGVERISVGAITHSAKALDISLEIAAVPH